MHLIMFLIFGLVVGAIARFLVPGRTSGGWVVTIVLGIAGSFLGGYMGRLSGIYPGGQAAGWVMSILGAVVVIIVYDAVVGRRSTV